MSDPTPAPVLLTIRGKAKPTDPEALRKLHNATAGSAEGIAAARSLGDLSHKVYTPLPGAPGAAAGELMFHDVWEDPKGIMQFFSNPHVQAQGGELFSEKDATVWMPARGAATLHLPAPSLRTQRVVGILRGAVSTPERAIEVFAGMMQKRLRPARKLGLMAHDLYLKVAAPGDDGPVELLGVDVWHDAAGMREYYQAVDMSALAPAFAGKPEASTWVQAEGDWTEW